MSDEEEVVIHVFDFDGTLTAQHVQLDAEAVFWPSVRTWLPRFLERQPHVIVCSFNWARVVRRALAQILPRHAHSGVRLVTSDTFALTPSQAQQLADRGTNLKVQYLGQVVQLHRALGRRLRLHYYDDDAQNIAAVERLRLVEITTHYIDRSRGNADIRRCLREGCA